MPYIYIYNDVCIKDDPRIPLSLPVLEMLNAPTTVDMTADGALILSSVIGTQAIHSRWAMRDVNHQPVSGILAWAAV